MQYVYSTASYHTESYISCTTALSHLVEAASEGDVDDVGPLRPLGQEELVDPFQALLQPLGSLLGREVSQLLGQPQQGFHEEPVPYHIIS